ncbi:MAG: SbcC/MukB-like Walker B domain-containing protein [Bacillota bacterium]
MRPKLLEIEGLQSFREVQKIDFDTLGETGLFGIFGPTGSGKSTVLDAITFALYGRVKRAERGTQGIINTNLSTARVSFTFELIKGSSRKTYRAERTYRRKKGSDNSCEPKVARLIEVTPVGEIPLCDKASEVSSHIEELLGLGHDDFTRAVVLPQNSFQEFLLLDNAKKREMLERIFYLEEYGKQLWEKLNRKMSRLKSRIDRLSGELSAYADASDQALEEAQKAMEAAVSERARAEEDLRALAAKYNEAKDVWQLVQDLDFINHKEQQQISAGEAVSEKRVQLEKAVKADGLLEMIGKNNELSSKLNETEKKLREVMDRLPVVVFALDETRQKYVAIKSEALTEQPKLVGLKARLLDALGIKAEMKAVREKINELQTAAMKLRNEITNKDGAIGRETKGLEELEQALSRFRLEMETLRTDPEYRQQIHEGARLENEVKALGENVNDLNIKAGELTGVVAGLEKKLDQIKEKISLSLKALDHLNAEKQKHEGSMPEDRNSILQYRERLLSFKAAYDVLKLRRNELEGMNSRLARQQSTLGKYTEKILALEKGKAKAGALHEQSRLELEQAVRAMDRNTAYLLSKNLKEGEACPVCGSERHPNPARADGTELAVLEQQVEIAGKRLADAEKALKDVEKEYLVMGEQIKALNDQIGQSAQELELKTREYGAAQLELPDELRSLELEQLRFELDRMSGLSAEKLKAIEAWEKKQEEYRVELQRINDQLSRDSLVESGIVAELKVNRENREQSENALKAANKKYQEKHKLYLEFLQHHKIESVTSELKRFAENDHKMNLLQKQMDERQQSLNKKRILLEQLKEEIRLLKNEDVRVEADSSNFVKQIAEKEFKLKELAGDANIEEQINLIDEKLEEFLKLEGHYQERLKALETQNNELTALKSTLDNQRDIYAGSLKNEEDRLQSALLEKGFIDSTEVEKSIIPKEKQKILYDEIHQFEQAERNIQAQKGMLLSKLDSRSITEGEWNHLSDAYQKMVVLKEECVSLSEVARNNFNTLLERHGRWVALNKIYSGLTGKYGLFEQIQRLLRAERGKDNSFIDFIAEERLRYVAAKASETLGVMTRYKYALELDTDAGFIIRDNANGGVHRMVNSLSGGETFLTSLSLALALSDQIQLKGQSPLEFFFLDEGFGTLDNNLLDTVIDSLERLSKKERVIGIISHVPELKSRIARRLIVDPPSSRGDGSRVWIEKA